MVKIAFLQKSTDAKGGSKASLLNTLKALQSLPTVSVHVFVEKEGEYTRKLMENSIEYSLAPFPRWRNLLDRITFRKVMKNFATTQTSYDWIISNEMWWAPHAVELAKNLDARSGAIIRDEIATSTKVRQYRFEALDAIITVADDLRNQLTEDNAIFEKTRTIYNIVDSPKFAADQQAHFLGLVSQHRHLSSWIVSPGTICERKDPILALQALASLRDQFNTQAGILFVGAAEDGAYFQAVKTEVARLNLKDRVIFTGQLPSIGAALDVSTMVLLTSHSEGLPRVLVESILSDKIAVSTKVSGVDEIFGELKSKYVLQERTPEALAKLLYENLKEKSSDDILLLKEKALLRFSREAHLQHWQNLIGI